jgi:hypothetical protein
MRQKRCHFSERLECKHAPWELKIFGDLAAERETRLPLIPYEEPGGYKEYIA